MQRPQRACSIGSSGSGGGGGWFSDGSRTSAPAASAWLNSWSIRCTPCAIMAGMPSLFGSRQREAADDLIVGAMAGDEPRARRAARIEPLQLNFRDQDVGRAVDDR